MTTLRDELYLRFQQGKDALLDNDLDKAINSFERAAEISKSLTPFLKSLYALSYAYLALALGKKKQIKEALEKITIASEYFPEEYTKPQSYALILLGIGVEFQKLDLFECSSLVLKSALKLARSHIVNPDLEVISVIARNLAFSYSKILNNKPAAKLFRIAADLEDNSQSAIDLYRNSSYIYYQEGFKEEALNILETAFEKAGIIGEKSDQIQIAQFQARISHEIFNYYNSNNLLEQALAYIDLTYQKFDFIDDYYWKVKTLYDKAITLGGLNNIWQRNVILNKIVQYESTEETEEIIIRSILLLVIHSLETNNFANADLYIQKISDQQMKNIQEKNPKLAEKVQTIIEFLKKSQIRVQLQTNMKYSRKDLELPVEELISETIASTTEVSTLYGDLNELKPPDLDVTISQYTANSKMKTPSVEILQDLFAEEEKHQIEESIRIREEKPYISAQIENEQEDKIDLEKIFRAHQTFQEPRTPILIMENRTKEISTEPTISDEQIRSDVCRRLQKAGWKVQLNFSTSLRRGTEPDILAEKGLIRKNRKMIFFAEDAAEAELCSFLLQSNPETGEKIVYLLNGNPKDVNIASKIKIASQIGQIL